MENIGATDAFLVIDKRLDELKTNEARGLLQSELEQCKSQAGGYTVGYHLMCAKTMLNRLRKDFALSPWKVTGAEERAQQRFENVRSLLADIEEEVRLFQHAVKTKENFQVVNKQPTVLLTTFVDNISVRSGGDLFTPCIKKAWRVFEKEENIKHFATVKRNSYVLVDFFKKLAESSDDADIKIQAERIYMSVEQQLKYISDNKPDYDLKTAETEIEFTPYVKGE